MTKLKIENGKLKKGAVRRTGRVAGGVGAAFSIFNFQFSISHLAGHA